MSGTQGRILVSPYELRYNKCICKSIIREEKDLKKQRLLKFITLSALTAGCLYAVNTAIDQQASSKYKLPYKPENFYRSSAGRIFYTKLGSGSPLLLIHDADPASSAFEWNEIAPILAKTHTVYLIDLPGCGRSEKINQTYTNFVFVKAIHEFIRDMIVEGTPTVIATGLSAPIVSMLSVFDAECLNKAVFIDPAVIQNLSKENELVGKICYYLLKCPILGTSIYNCLFSRNRIDSYFINNRFYNPFIENDELVDTYYEAAHLRGSNGKHLQACISGNYVNADCEHTVRNMTTTSLVIEGEAVAEHTDVTQNWKSLSDRISSKVIVGAKHLPQIEQPEKTAEVIENFIGK